jgi:hypothetical protein
MKFVAKRKERGVSWSAVNHSGRSRADGQGHIGTNKGENV